MTKRSYVPPPAEARGQARLFRGAVERAETERDADMAKVLHPLMRGRLMTQHDLFAARRAAAWT